MSVGRVVGALLVLGRLFAFCGHAQQYAFQEDSDHEGLKEPDDQLPSAGPHWHGVGLH